MIKTHRVIYADTLVIMNAVVTYILLLSVRSFGRIKVAAWRLIPASFFGGAASLLVLVDAMPAEMTVVLKLVLCALITMIAFFDGDGKRFLRSLLHFSLMTFLYGGLMLFLSHVFSKAVVYQNGVGYIGISFTGLVIAVSAVYLILKFVHRKYGSDPERYNYKISISHGDRTANGNALYDSGHFVTDCYNGQPVVIVRSRLLRQLLPDAEMARLTAMGDFNECISPGYLNIRYIPVHTVSGEKLLPAFTCDNVTVSDETTFVDVKHVSIALAAFFDEGAEYDALINEQLFERR